MTTPASGEISIQDIVDEFGGSAPHALSEYYGAASGVPTSGQITLSDFYGVSSFTMPSGIIIPYNGSSAPTGWTLYTNLNSRMVVGAGSSYSVGSGGSSSLSAPASFSNSGSHNGNTGTSHSNGFSYPVGGASSAGSHSHNATLSASSVLPPYKQYSFLKASSDQSSIPAGGVILGVSTISGTGVSAFDSGIDRALYGGNSYGSTGGSNTHGFNGTTTSAGGHLHGSGSSRDGDERADPFASSSGSHTHASTGTATINVKKIYASAWTNASSAFTFEGAGIAMWESATPPAGWSICNGANGTPDMRDYFVYIGSTGNHGTVTNTTGYNWTASASNTVNHGHEAGTGPATGGYNPGRHPGFSWSHSHNASGSGSYTPPYYALYFIQYTG